VDFPTVFRPETFVATITSLVATSGAWLWLQRVGILLAAIFFLYNLYMALATQSGSWVTEAVIRAGIVGAVLANLGVVVGAMIALHQAFSAIGGAIFDALAGPEVYQDVIAELNAARDAATAAAANQPWWQLVNAFGIMLSTWIPILAFLLFIGAAIAIYNFLLFGSYLMLAMAVVMLPVSIAFFVTRSLQRFTYEWFQVVLHSSLIVMLAKAAAGIIGNQAVLEPIRDYARSVQAAAAAGGFAGIDLRALVGALIGITIGMFSLLAVQGIASAFVGRVESVAGSIAAMYATMRMAPVVAGTAAGAALGAAQWGTLGAQRVSAAVRARPAGAGPPGGGDLEEGAEPGGVDRTFPGGLSASEYLDRSYAEWLEPHIEWQRRVLGGPGGDVGEGLPAPGPAAGGQAPPYEPEPPGDADGEIERLAAEEVERVRREDIQRSLRDRPDAG
jgi:hypothetical protein